MYVNDYIIYRWVQLIKAPYAKIYNIIKTQTMSADSTDEVTHLHVASHTGCAPIAMYLCEPSFCYY